MWLERATCAVLATLLATSGAGCASVEVRDDGSTLFLGCARVVTRPYLPRGEAMGEFLEVGVLGLLLLSSPSGGGLAIGLARERSVVLGADSKLVIDPLLPLQSITRGASQ